MSTTSFVTDFHCQLYSASVAGSRANPEPKGPQYIADQALKDVIEGCKILGLDPPRRFDKGGTAK